ncbi:zona pellucida glycoprotein d [Girardinichthys multiradiatus]|uniref:zona pellucida glycoprotein d n=1 Tax=Girardinichthys multiradiatus TaxID=208333 RepID=UPI001FAE660D|nr:zona pellucida glycoprotein d [Girardinichthys multiradiatus]
MKQIFLKIILVLFSGFMCLRVEGICSVEHCTDPTRCVLSGDQRSCKCASGFYSAQCDQSAQMKVMCGRDYMSIRATEEFFLYHKVPLEALHLPNKSCHAQREVIRETPYYMFRISKEKYLACGGKPLRKNTTHLLYSLTVQSAPQVIGNIIRDPVIKMEFTCIYPYIRRVSLPFPVLPLSSETVMQVDEMDATIHMLLYADHAFTKAYTSAPTIELRDKVYVEVAVTEPADYFLLRVNDCWATQSPQLNSTKGLLHSLIHNGCVDDQTVSFLSLEEGQSGNNGESSTVRYSFDMFRFTTEPPELYLHCSVQLCELDDLKSCMPSCKAISKREALREYPSQGLLSYGPIKIEMPDQPESSILMTVVLPVAGVWTLSFFITVLISVAKAGSRRIPKTEAH